MARFGGHGLGGRCRCLSTYFDGDPATDSTRRHLERVLHAPKHRRWRRLVAMLAGGVAWRFWRVHPRSAKPPDARTSASTSPPRLP